jgi:hypothetical protein
MVAANQTLVSGENTKIEKEPVTFFRCFELLAQLWLLPDVARKSCETQPLT